MKKNRFIISCIILLLTFTGTIAQPSYARQLYSIEVNDSLVKTKADSAIASFVESNPLLGNKTLVINQVEKPHKYVNKTMSFYLVLLLLFVLGVLRLAFPTYFRHLYNAFMSPLLSKRQLREQIEQNIQANVAMNIFFCVSIGFYIYSILFSQNKFIQEAPYSPNIILSAFIACVGLVYLTKFVLLKFLGWVFKIDTLTEAYAYNVFLVNKILAVILLPFSIIMAFGTGAWLQVIFLISLLIVAILLFNRYTRSWSTLGSFFQFSRFHFFMYFCASELLPLAILIKLAHNWLT